MTRLLATAAALTLAATALAQTPTAIPPPTSGLIVNYKYWPTQYIQFVGSELPYAMIELDVDTAGKQQLLYVTLTDRATGKRIHYTNNDGLIAMSKAQNEEAHKTAIAFEGGDTTNTGSIVTVRFSMADGKPLQWRFVQGSDISEQGSGLTPLPTVPIPIFAYREQAAVAGEGTALQIGDTVSTADIWKEISQPPYFIAYHGALSQSAHTVAFTPGSETWTVASSPATLSAGSTWELDSAAGDHRSLKIEKADGTRFLITGTDRFQPAVHFTLDATRTGDGWSVASVRYAPNKEGDKHSMTLTLPASASGEVTLSVGKKKSIATGTLTTAGTAADRTETLNFASPAWLKGKTMTEETVATPTTITASAHPAS